MKLPFTPTVRNFIFTIVGLLILLLVIGGVFGFRMFNLIKKYEAMRMPASTVSTATVHSQDWQPYLDSIGSLTAIQGVSIAPEVSGIVNEIDFESGQMVKKGDVLAKLDTNVLSAQLEQARASLTLAQINFDRQANLLKQGATTQSDYDSAQATLTQDLATVAQNQALLQQKIITAPFAGQVGIRSINLGQYLSAGDIITTLQQISPIFVDYSLPQEDNSKIYLNQSVEISTPSCPKKVFTGKLTAMSPLVDATTRSLSLRALVDNSDASCQLLPGMMVTVHTLLPAQRTVLTVPQTAISYTLYGNSVFVVKKVPESSANPRQQYTGFIAKQVYVTTGSSLNDQVQILNGLQEKEVVVTAGQIKLQDGFSVNPQASS